MGGVITWPSWSRIFRFTFCVKTEVFGGSQSSPSRCSGSEVSKIKQSQPSRTVSPVQSDLEETKTTARSRHGRLYFHTYENITSSELRYLQKAEKPRKKKPSQTTESLKSAAGKQKLSIPNARNVTHPGAQWECVCVCVAVQWESVCVRVCVAASLNQRPSVAMPKTVSRLNSWGAELSRWQQAAGEGTVMNKEEVGGVRAHESGGRSEKWRDSKMLPSLKL